MNKKLKTARVLGKNNKGLQIRRKRHTNFVDKKTIAKNLLKILQGTSFENILNNHQVSIYSFKLDMTGQKMHVM